MAEEVAVTEPEAQEAIALANLKPLGRMTINYMGEPPFTIKATRGAVTVMRTLYGPVDVVRHDREVKDTEHRADQLNYVRPTPRPDFSRRDREER